MKKILLIGLLGLIVGFAGCKKDDDNYSSSDLVGKWYLANDTGFWYWDGEREDYNDSYTKENSWLYWTFSSDGAFKAENLDEDLVWHGTWNLNGNKLVVKPSGQPSETVNIKSLSSTSVVVYQKGTDEDGPWESTLSFKKIN